MKKILTVFITVLISVTFIVGIAFAFGTLDYEFKNDTEKDNTAEKQPMFTVENAKVDINVAKSFANLFATRALTYEGHMSVESYVNFILIHDLSQNEIDQITALVKKGTPMGTIHNIYEFYLTTNDDFSIISDIASYEERYYGKNWIEDAYNDITDKKHGVIERDEAHIYLADFTNSEILYANVLSRKGIFTIDEILDKRKSGMTWNELTDAIYSSVPQAKAVGSVKERLEIEQYLKDEIFDYDSSPYEVHKFAFLCAINGVVVSDGVINGQNMTAYYDEVYTKLDESQISEVGRVLESCGMSKTFMSAQTHTDYNSKYYNVALKSGMSEADIAIFEDKGFSMREIAESFALFKNDPCAMIEHIKSERGDMLK